ncbi:MAG TPA: DUF763 domain-containing protein [Anaerolineae bacterium]|nr:DUF763 domain-containing protein [Anaerolineae bacterium]
MKTGTADLPLHYGKAPRWLFQRMARLAREIAIVMVDEFGTAEFLRRLADPLWFQALGCVLGYDWHSSGLTTVTCGALKEGLKELGGELGLYVAGGKGATSRRTPAEIEARGQDLAVDPAGLVYASRMAAKVDSAALQDGYQLYHHTFVFDRQGRWAIIQQGMNPLNRYARRYHWLSEAVEDFVREPHAAICCDQAGQPLNLVAAESEEARRVSTSLSQEKPWRVVQKLKRLQTLTLPAHHEVLLRDIHPDRLGSIFLKTYERQPEDFEALLGMRGVGPKTIRALGLIAELVYGTPLSFRDPVRYSFAHGGKDGHPYPVDRATYDRSIQAMERAIRQAKLGNREKLEAFRRLARWSTGGG